MIVSSAVDYFPKSELACPCCGTIRIAKGFMDLVQLLRSETHPFLIISCSRCQRHNQSKGVGGHESSLHLLDNPKHLTPTIACDVSMYRWPEPKKQKFYKAAKALGFSIGVKENSIHLDFRELVGLPRITFKYGYVPNWFANIN